MDKLNSLLGGDAGESTAQALKEKMLHETIENKVESVAGEKVADSAPVQKAIGTAVDMLTSEDSSTGAAGAAGAGAGIGGMASKLAGSLTGSGDSASGEVTDQLEKAGAGGIASQLQGVIGGIGGGSDGPAPSSGLASQLEGVLGGDEKGAGGLGALAAGMLKK